MINLRLIVGLWLLSVLGIHAAHTSSPVNAWAQANFGTNIFMVIRRSFKLTVTSPGVFTIQMAQNSAVSGAFVYARPATGILVQPTQ